MHPSALYSPGNDRPATTGPECDLSRLDDLSLLDRMLSCRSERSGAVARDLLTRFGGLAEVTGADSVELSRIEGMDGALIETLKTIREAGLRLARVEAAARPAIASWTALVAYARTALGGLPREQFRVLFLDRRNRLLSDELRTTGTVDHAPVYVREILRRALEASASSMILIHNHPSGDPTPSQADIAMTRQIVEGARVFNIQVHDHLIVGREGTASFRSLGLI